MPHRIIFPRRGEVALENFDPAPLASRQVRVRTEYSLVSIGTELTILHQRYDPKSHFAEMFSFPQLKTGVQAVGIVEQRGADVSDFAVGDRIFMRMAHGSHQVLPAAECSPVPDSVPPKLACWCGLAKTAFRAAWAGRFSNSESVLIIGAGPVGQMTTRWAKFQGVEQIGVIDIARDRLHHAEQGGATEVWCGDIADTADEIRASFAGVGPALVVDTTGNAGVFRHALDISARFGRIILLGDTGFPNEQRLTSDVMTKGLSIQATHDSHDRDGWNQRKVDSLFFDAVTQGRFDLSDLISREFSPDQCQEAYRLAEQDRGRVMGILFDWGAISE